MFGQHAGMAEDRGTATTGGAARGRVDGPIADHRIVAASECYRDMFLADLALVTRRPWPRGPGLARAGRRPAVRSRRAGIRSPRTTTSGSSRRISPASIGQDLLERGFPRDAASSQVVLVCERTDGPLTPAGFRLCRRHGRPVLPVRPGAPRAGLQEAGHPPLAGDRPAAHRRRRRRPGPGGAHDHRAQRHLPGQDDADRRRPHPGVARDRSGPGRRRGPGPGDDRLRGRRPRHQRGGQREHRQHDLDDDHPGGRHPAGRLSIAAPGDGARWSRSRCRCWSRSGRSPC